jgi:hypothetical protein
VEWPFDLLQQIADVVQSDSGAPAPEAARANLKRRAFAWPVRHQAAAERVIDDVAKRAAGPARRSFQLRGHVIVEGERRAHIMMIGADIV